MAAPRAVGPRAAAARWSAFFPFFRAFVAIEATLLALAAAIADAFVGRHPGHARARRSRWSRSRRSPRPGTWSAILTSSRLR